MWRKSREILFLVLVLLVLPLSMWASVQRDTTFGEFKNDADWAFDVLDVKKLKRSLFSVGGKNANLSSLGYFEVTVGLVKVLPFNLGFYVYDSEAIFSTNNPAHRTNLDFSGGSDQNVLRTVSEQKLFVDNSTRIFATAADLSAIGLPFSLFSRVTYRGNNTTNATFGINFATFTLAGITNSTIEEMYSTTNNQISTRRKTTYGDGTSDATSLRNELTAATKLGDLVILFPLTLDMSGMLQKATYSQVEENPVGNVVAKDTAELVRDGKNILLSVYPRIAFSIVKGTDLELALNVGYGLRGPQAVVYKRVQENVNTSTVTETEYKEDIKNYLHLPLAFQVVGKQSYKLGDTLSLKGRLRATVNYTLSSLERQTERFTQTKVAGTVTASEKIVIKDTISTNALGVDLQLPFGVEYSVFKWLVLRMGTRFDYTLSMRWAQQIREKPSRDVDGNPAPIHGTSYDPVNTMDSSYAFATSSATRFALGFGWLATEQFQLDFGYEFGGSGDIFSLSQWRVEAIYRF